VHKTHGGTTLQGGNDVDVAGEGELAKRRQSQYKIFSQKGSG
jgi:hypothetical protein